MAGRMREFDAGFVRDYFNSRADVESGATSRPPVGKVFGIEVGAPGIGRNYYRVAGYRADGTMLAEFFRSDAREMTAAEVR